MRIVVDEQLNPHDEAIIRDRLVAFNDQRIESAEGHIGILVKNDAGQTVGGLTAHWYYNWMFVEYLYLPEELRGSGTGTELLAEAERLARRHGLDGIWLDTYDFQARGFYEKLGFAVFGELPDYPVGHKRFFLQKRL
jgi:GNAT superfamily N-acetyltransferase